MRTLGVADLQQTLQDLGLRGAEARVLLAVLRLGKASSPEVARQCGISRTNVYRVLEELALRRLIERVPGDGPALWASPGVEQVLERLYVDQQEHLVAEKAAEEERLAAFMEEHQRRLRELHEAHDESISGLDALVAAARQLLSEVAADGNGPLPKVQLIPSAGQLDKAYDDLLEHTRSELLVLVRPPYAHTPGAVKPAIIDALARGVQARVVYEGTQLTDPDAEGFRREIEAYHRAGVEARVADQLPIKMAVFDRAAVLIALVDPGDDRTLYPTFLLVEHRGFATFQAEAFDHRWTSAEPYSAPIASE